MSSSSRGAVTSVMVENFKKDFRANPANRVVLNAVTKTSIRELAMNREVLAGTDFTFSNEFKTGPATEQKSTGRCWLFAGLNFLRIKAMKKMNLETFELSQSYCFFWDKLEKSNYFLENIIETRHEDLHCRLVMWLLQAPLGDGGQWDMFNNLIKRYGVVPKSVMPETFNSSNSKFMNYLLTLKLREYGSILREMHQNNVKVAKLHALKKQMLSEIYRMLVIYFGSPPERFVWQYRDKKEKFHRDPNPLTPLEFYKKNVGLDLDEMVSLIHCPTPDKPFNKMYTVEYLGNIVGGEIVKYLNVDLKTFKNAAVKQLKKNEPVWFGCDVGKMVARENGIMHARLYEYDKLLGTTFNLNKAQRIDYGDSRMTHAMVFIGVDLLKNKPVKWKVENSWGEKCGEKGFFVMSDDWFDEYMYQVIVPRKSLSAKLQKILKEKPVHLKPWDPMGSLAIMI